MNLPNTRERTYVDGDPIIPGDLNSIQDSIIGVKHPLIEINLHASLFIPVGAGAVYNGSIWTGGGGGFNVYCGLAVPAGDRFTQATFGYNRANAGTITYQLIRKPIAGGAVVVVGTANDVATNGFAANTIAFFHTFLAGNSYAVEMIMDAAADAAGSAFVGMAVFTDKL